MGVVVDKWQLGQGVLKVFGFSVSITQTVLLSDINLPLNLFYLSTGQHN
jgi:hypothetical protein